MTREETKIVLWVAGGSVAIIILIFAVFFLLAQFAAPLPKI